MFERRELAAGWRFDWLIRTRPDLYFYSSRMPESRRSTRAPSTCACDASPSPSQTFLRRQPSSSGARAAPILNLRRKRIQPSCPPNATRVDDSLLVPRQLMSTYFSVHEVGEEKTAGRSEVTGDVCPPFRDTAAASPAAQPARVPGDAHAPRALQRPHRADGLLLPSRVRGQVGRRRQARSALPLVAAQGGDDGPKARQSLVPLRVSCE